MEGIFDEELEGETPEQADELIRAAALEGIENRDEKIRRMIRFVKAQSRLLEGIEAELAAMQRRREVVQNRIARCEYLAQQICPPVKGEKFKIETDSGVFSWRFSERVERADGQVYDHVMPPELMREIPATFEPNKKAIKEALKEGREVPGWELKQYVGMVIK